MSRTNVTNGKLRACPTCLTPVEEAKLGLRNFDWLSDYLPGKVGPTDIDAVLDNDKTGRMLAMEFKPSGAAVGLGQRITFRNLRKRNVDVWIIWGTEDDIEVAEYTWRIGPKEKLTKDALGKRLAEWWAGT